MQKLSVIYVSRFKTVLNTHYYEIISSEHSSRSGIVIELSGENLTEEEAYSLRPKIVEVIWGSFGDTTLYEKGYKIFFSKENFIRVLPKSGPWSFYSTTEEDRQLFLKAAKEFWDRPRR